MNNQDLQNRAFEQSFESFIHAETGIDIGPDNFRKATAELSPLQRRKLRRALARYSKAQAMNARKLRESLTYSAFSGIKRFTGVFVRGAAAGISVAGVVNTIAPGLFSTLCGYLAGSANGKIILNGLARVGLVSLGVFASPAFTQYAILVIGAVTGIIVYAIIVFFGWAARKLVLKFQAPKA